MLLFKIILILLLIPIDGVLIFSILRGAPFATTRHGVVEKMIGLVGVRTGERAVDLGSGDGRMVIALARAGAQAEGYEINPLLVLISRWRIRRAGVADHAKIYWRSFWNVDMSAYTVVTVFGMWHFMEKLGEKLIRELPSHARVVCNTYQLPQWTPIKKEHKIFLYKK